jgi:transcriptional regulator with XRE-family HTH domain
MKRLSRDTIEKSFEELSRSVSESDRIMIETRLLMYRFLSEIDKIIAERGISRKELAQLAGTSASYITQLYQGKKIINLQMLTRIKKALNINFKIEVVRQDEKIEDYTKKSVVHTNSLLYKTAAKSHNVAVRDTRAIGKLTHAKTAKISRPQKS